MSQSFWFDSRQDLLDKKRLFMLSISSMLGIGIFIKSKTLNELAHFSIWPLVVLFFLSGILIISMTFSFTRLVNNQSLSGRSFVEWAERYCNLHLKNWTVKFTKNFAHPISLITTSLFLVKWINGAYVLWIWESVIVATIIGAVIVSLNTFSLKFAELFQRCLSFCIILSLIYVSAFGIVSIFNGGGQQQNGAQQGANTEGLNRLGPWTIVFSGLVPIFFMYDGFYSVLSLKDRAKSKTSFKTIVLYSFCLVTLLYLCIIIISLLGAKGSGDFLKFSHFQNKHLNDVLIVLIALTFLSSLNVSTICGQNQLLHLHYKYNFSDFNQIRRRILNRGHNLLKFKLESKLSTWLYLIKKMIIISLILATIAQLNYWLNNSSENILWSLNEILAELNSLLIFAVLGLIAWNAKIEEKKKFFKFFYYFSAASILIGFLYYFLNGIVTIFTSSGKIIPVMRILFLIFLLVAPSFSYIRAKMSPRKNWELQENKLLTKLNGGNSLIKFSNI